MIAPAAGAPFWLVLTIQRPGAARCAQMVASPPAVVSSPPLPHSDVVPGISARSPTPTPAPGPAAIGVRAHRPPRDRCTIQVSGSVPPVTTGIQIPPAPSEAKRSGCCTVQGATNLLQRAPSQWASTRCPASPLAGEVPDIQTLVRDRARTSSSWVSASAASAARTSSQPWPS